MTIPNEILDDIAKLEVRISRGPFSQRGKELMLKHLHNARQELKDDVW